ncbi:hypothetical protein [Phenylobacterium sp.]|uniref:hypothetical protein n=1 Tax=Phenylobacterium sp. TaxID=1871053 RepID=UPI0035660442
MDVSAPTRTFLESLQRNDLATLVGACRVTIARLDANDDWLRQTIVVVSVEAPAPVDEGLANLPDFDRKRIAEAAASATEHLAPEDIEVTRTGAEPVGGAPGLLAELLIQRATMISVATGGTRIQEVDDYYIAREARIRAQMPGAVVYGNPYPSLWDWYAFWKDSLPTYADRRKYARELFAGSIAAIATRSWIPARSREPTGWERVDRTVAKARAALEAASAEEDWQGIGLLCREAMISLAQAVYDPALHDSLDGLAPSATDANRMLEAYIAYAFPGPSNKEVRAHGRASLALALNLQHRRTATRQLAALCLEATSSTVSVISIIARPDL